MAADADFADVDERLAAVCTQLMDRLDSSASEIASKLVEQLPQYSTAMSFDELVEAVHRNIEGIVESVRLSRTQSLSGPRNTGRRRAEQGVPLDVVLTGYRLGVMHVWDELVSGCEQSDAVHLDRDRPARATRALLSAASALWTEFDTHAHEVSRAYNDVATERFRRDHRRRQVLLTRLFAGDAGPDSTLVEVAGVLGISTDGPFVVVMSDASSAGTDFTENSRKYLADNGIETIFKAGARGDLGLISVAPPVGLDRVVRLVAHLELGRAGISRSFTGLSDITTAVAQARMARDAGRDGSQVVTRFDDAQVPALVLNSPDIAAGLVQHVFGPLHAMADSERTMLVETLRAWFDHSGSNETAGAALHCHPNTVRYRLNKLTSALDRDLKDPSDLVHLFLAAEAVRLRATRPRPR